MSLRNQWHRCVAYCLLAQLILVSIAVGGLWWETRHFYTVGRLSLFLPTDGSKIRTTGVTLRGWPIAWAESRQDVTHDTVALDSSRAIRGLGYQGYVTGYAAYGPPQFQGWNPALPIAVLLIAVFLPAVVTDWRLRRLQEGGPQPSGLSARLLRVGLLAGLAGVGITIVEMETADSQWDYSPGQKWAVGYAPSQFVDTLIIDLRHGWFAPTETHTGEYLPSRFIHGSDTYKFAYQQASDYRCTRLPYEFHAASANLAWRFRTVITATGIVFGLLLGCLIYRPWRCPKLPERPPHGADGASAPSA